jgi:hypothetical protein
MDAHAHTPHMLQGGEGHYAGAPQQYSLRSSGSDARRTDSASTIMSPHITRPASDKSSVYDKHRRHFRVASPRGQLLGNTNAGLPAVRVNLAARGPSLPRTPRTQSAANSQLQSHHTTSFWKVVPSPSSSQRLRPLRAGEGAEVQLDRFGDPIVLQSATRSLGRTSDDYRRPDALTKSNIRTVLQPCARPPRLVYPISVWPWTVGLSNLVLTCRAHLLVHRLLVYTGNSLQIEGRSNNSTCQLQSIRQRRFTPHMEEHLNMAPPTVRASRR